MRPLEEFMPDEDRREAVLIRLLERIVAGRVRTNGAHPMMVKDYEASIMNATRARHGNSANELDVKDVMILRCLAVGMTTRETDDITGFGFEFVKQRLKKIRRVLRAKTRAHAVANAFRQGIIE